MTRQRIQLKRIECEERRRECYRKRKEGLKKKIYELSTLCGDEKAFLVCYGPTGEVVTWPPDNSAVRELVEKYQSLTAETKAKHNLNMSSYLLSEIGKQQKRLNKITAVDDLLAPWNDDRWLDDMTEVELRELLQPLDDTLERTRRRIAYLYAERCADGCLESGRAETVSCFTYPTTSADEDVYFATETAPCFTYPTTPLADGNDNSMSYYSAMCSDEFVESGLAETVPQFLTYPTLLVDEDDNFATTMTTDLNQTEIPFNGYLHNEEPTVDVNFNSNNVFFALDYNNNTSPLVSTSNTSVQEENNLVNTFSASTATQIYTTALYYYG